MEWARRWGDQRTTYGMHYTSKVKSKMLYSAMHNSSNKAQMRTVINLQAESAQNASPRCARCCLLLSSRALPPPAIMHQGPLLCNCCGVLGIAPRSLIATGVREITRVTRYCNAQRDDRQQCKLHTLQCAMHDRDARRWR